LGATADARQPLDVSFIESRGDQTVLHVGHQYTQIVVDDDKRERE
jgi:hypothetical protein